MEPGQGKITVASPEGPSRGFDPEICSCLEKRCSGSMGPVYCKCGLYTGILEDPKLVRGKRNHCRKKKVTSSSKRGSGLVSKKGYINRPISSRTRWFLQHFFRGPKERHRRTETNPEVH